MALCGKGSAGDVVRFLSFPDAPDNDQGFSHGRRGDHADLPPVLFRHQRPHGCPAVADARFHLGTGGVAGRTYVECSAMLDGVVDRVGNRRLPAGRGDV